MTNFQNAAAMSTCTSTKRAALLLSVCLLLFSSAITAQETVTGVVIEEQAKGQLLPVPFANVYWLGTQVGTSTDTLGQFELPYKFGRDTLVISYVGYKSDTIKVAQPDQLTIVLKRMQVLDAVEVSYRAKGTEISYMNTLKVETMGEKELFKAACCNLSESFETNPSIDVAFTDAVTGTKQIRMLGLAGKYSQVSREQMPGVRGLGTVSGMTYIPGTWIESIQLNKGAGSVTNGYESITGQINVELEKPEEAERIFFNAYANQGGRTEANLNAAHRFSEKVSTAVLLHGNLRPFEIDGNDDGFLDFPTGYQINGINRWKFNTFKGWEGQVGVNGLMEDRTSGWVGEANNIDLRWRTNRLEAWAKAGYVFPEKKYQSIGFQASALQHEFNNDYDQLIYSGTQQSGYFNSIFQSIIGSTTHKYRAGLSLVYDNFQESIDQLAYERTEIVPGAFFEYTYTYFEQFSAVVGLRADYHNYYGAFVTPRLHLRYAPVESTVIRASGGRGQRTANPIAENMAYLVSSRAWVIEGDANIPGYGLAPEVGWNAGLNITQDFKLDYRPGTIALDAYQTWFEQQTVIDIEDPRQVRIYNLDGQSFATSLQAQVDYELWRNLDVRLAYRWNEVRTTYSGVMKNQPFLPKHRAFANVGYEIPTRGWAIDYTIQWQGNQRIPSTAGNPLEYQMPMRSPNLVMMNAQITKSWRDVFDLYVGMENITNVRQSNPIIAANDPYGPYFDASMVWGPIFGRMTYVGLRLRTKS